MDPTVEHVSVTLDQDSYIGILFSSTGARPEDTEPTEKWTRERLRHWTCTEGFKQAVPGVEVFFPLKIYNMPCGESITFEREEDIPLDDMPCRCGNPKHWFIRWEWKD